MDSMDEALRERAPIGIKGLQAIFSKVSLKRRDRWYKGSVLILTFLGYTSYHLAKRPISVVKGTLNPNCTVTDVNNTCDAWSPFDNPVISKELFSALDSAFLFTYAVAMFASGYIAEHTSLRAFLGLGMIATGLFTCLFGAGYYLNIHQIVFFVVAQVLSGLFQSTGWPCVVACVGNWFGEGRRGLIMGIWNSHVSVGNIAGSTIAGIWSGDEWGLSFIVPGCIIAGLGIIMLLFLVTDPLYVGVKKEKTQLKEVAFVRLEEDIPDKIKDRLARNSTVIEVISPNRFSYPLAVVCDRKRQSRTNPDNIEAIGFLGALKIPGVVEYSICLFFAKLVSYTFLYWLPYYIKNTVIEGRILDSEDSADIATFFDVGAIVGGIAAGFLSDKTKCSGITSVVMLVLAAPSLFAYRFYGCDSLKVNIALMVVSGIFVNGPYALITTAVSASLGSHQSLRGSTKAMATVSAIIDGTGSLGAAVGPLLCGLITASNNWDNVFYFLIASVFVAALLLSRQVWFELKVIHSFVQSRRTKTFTSQQLVIERTPTEKTPLLKSGVRGNPPTISPSV